jgi:hypothetical protein
VNLTLALEQAKRAFTHWAIAAFVVVSSLSFILPLTVIVVVLLFREDPVLSEELTPITEGGNSKSRPKLYVMRN